MPLGAGASRRPVTAVMPFERLTDLQPIFSALMGKPEADILDLTLVADRRTASETLEMLRQAFDFYRLSGRLVVVGEDRNAAKRLDAGVAASSAPHVLAWNPCVLPKTEGWLEKMLEEAGRAEGLFSPSLLYEDGSVYFGGGASGRSGSCGASRFVGYGAHWLDGGLAAPVSVGAAEMVLAPRDLLAKVAALSDASSATPTFMSISRRASRTPARNRIGSRMSRSGCSTIGPWSLHRTRRR